MRPICAACGDQVSFPVRVGFRNYHYHCAPAEARPEGRWVPGAPVDNRPQWVKRMERNAKVLA